MELQEQEGCDGDTGAENYFFKEEAEASECDNKDWEQTKTEETDEPRTLLVIQEDGGYSDRVTWLTRAYELSESLKTARSSDSEPHLEEGDPTDAKSHNGRSDGVATSEHEAEEDTEDVEASELEDEGTFLHKMSNLCEFERELQ